MNTLKDDNIKLSVIVPIYNAAPYLGQCIQSICDQTYRRLQIILVDDGSTDESGEICDRFALMDARISVVHKENGGQLSALLAGGRIADGDYITCVDSDDWIDPDRYSHIVDVGLADTPDMVHIEGENWEYDDHMLYKEYKDIPYMFSGEEGRDSFLRFVTGTGPYLDRRIIPCHWKSFVRSDIFKRNMELMDTRISMIEDVIFMFSVIMDSESIACITESGYHYRQHEGSICHAATEFRKDHYRLFYEQFLRILDRHGGHISDVIADFVIQYSYHNILMANYTVVYDHFRDDCFPYVGIASGSRIIVYGAGYLGANIVNAIVSHDRHELVAWVDLNPRPNPRSGVEVQSPDKLAELDYDYILIAILVSSVSERAADDLISRGVRPECIRTMDRSVMTREVLEGLIADERNG